MALGALTVVSSLFLGTQFSAVQASDHDDGETQIKSRNLNLTDLYVFREDWQTGVTADSSNLIFVMNSNPRSLPRQQYFFNTEATYSFHVGRKPDANASVDGNESLRFDFQFGTPDANNQQSIQLSVVTFDATGAIVNTESVSSGFTTSAPPLIGNPNPTPSINAPVVNGTELTVFAGLREDPFFFDVEQFFRVRAAAAGAGPAATFFGPDQATDFAEGYNVNTIVMRVPIDFLQENGEPVFDVWETISIPNDLAARQ